MVTRTVTNQARSFIIPKNIFIIFSIIFTNLFAEQIVLERNVTNRVQRYYDKEWFEENGAEYPFIFVGPQCPADKFWGCYTESLLASVPRLTLNQEHSTEFVLDGDVPSAMNPPKGCPFHTRCSKCMEICKKEKPPIVEKEPGHFVACHRAEEVNE